VKAIDAPDRRESKIPRERRGPPMRERRRGAALVLLGGRHAILPREVPLVKVPVKDPPN
jgi:hypothetical protein